MLFIFLSLCGTFAVCSELGKVIFWGCFDVKIEGSRFEWLMNDKRYDLFVEMEPNTRYIYSFIYFGQVQCVHLDPSSNPLECAKSPRGLDELPLNVSGDRPIIMIQC
jgi:hypothetical protein